ncbi:MAG: Mrp/NBP35 family ATP-binding protein [Deltaproteobacteria bacterium]|nr:Mrp/NBP35 family ATP-binding protein [Deltaproteobacteria bacterium]
MSKGGFFTTFGQKRDTEKNKIAKKLAKIRFKIMVHSGKGGVGKSTVAANLATSFARQNFAVGLLDLDIHGPNIPKIMGIEEQSLKMNNKGIEPVSFLPNLKVVSIALLLYNREEPVIWRSPMKYGLIQQLIKDVNWGKLDYLIVDMPSGTGDDPLSIINILKQFNGTVIVTTPQELSLLNTKKVIQFALKMNIPVIGLIENMSGMVCPHCNQTVEIFRSGGGEKTAQEFEIPFLGRIPMDPGIVVSTDTGVPFVISQPKSIASDCFGEIAERIRNFIEKDEKILIYAKTIYKEE